MEVKYLYLLIILLWNSSLYMLIEIGKVIDGTVRITGKGADVI